MFAREQQGMSDRTASHRHQARLLIMSATLRGGELCVCVHVKWIYGWVVY